MMEKIEMKSAIVAYMEKPESWALPVAIFENEELYSICLPVIEQWVKKQNSNYILTESCGVDINTKEQQS
jgi:hypothetical protein